MDNSDETSSKKESAETRDLEKLPRKGSYLYIFVHGDEKTKKKHVNKYKFLNKYITVPLYRLRILPLIGFGRLFLLIYHVGRKSGKQYITPVEYHVFNGIITVNAARGKSADWIKNIKANPDKVQVLKGFKKFDARIEFVEDLNEKISFLKWYCKKHPRYAKSFFGWDPKRDDVEKVDFTDLARALEMIRIHEKKK